MTGGGVIAGLGLFAGVAGLVAAASLLPDPAVGGVDPVAVPVAEPARVLACPGPPVVTGSPGDAAVGAVGTGQDKAATDAQFRAAPAPTSATTYVLATRGDTSAATAVRLPAATAATRARTGERPGTQSLAALEAVGTVLHRQLSAPGAMSVTASPSGRRPANVAALSVASTPSGDLQGVAATSCAAPSADAWLVGGGTEAGRSARLVLENPSGTAAAVAVEVVTSTGVLAPPAGQDVVVPPGERRELLLEGLVSAEPTLAVHVTSTGGRVAAFLLYSAIDGLVPKGVDVVAPSSPPSRSQVVPALRFADDTATTLRLVATTSREAVVTWHLLGAGGQAATGKASVVTVPPDTAVDVDLGATGVPDGLYTLVLRSDAPVTAGVQMLRTHPDGSGTADRAWSPSTGPLAPTGDPDRTSGALVALPAAGPDAVAATLTLGALGVDNGQDGASADVEDDATVVVRQVTPDGTLGPPDRLAVPAGTTKGLSGQDLASGGSLGVQVVVQRGRVAAGVLLEQQGSLSAVPVHPSPAPVPTVEVRRVPPGALR